MNTILYETRAGCEWVQRSGERIDTQAIIKYVHVG